MRSSVPTRVAGGLARISGMLGPNGEVLHTGAVRACFVRRAFRQARPSVAGRTRRRLQEGRHRRRPERQHQPGSLGQVDHAVDRSRACAASMRGTIGDIMESRRRRRDRSPRRSRRCRKVAAAEGSSRPATRSWPTSRPMLTASAAPRRCGLDPWRHGEARRGRGSSRSMGDMLARARKHGIAAPNLRFAYAHLQTYEARRARGGLK
jgi:2-dehydropantoate 2-reductase